MQALSAALYATMAEDAALTANLGAFLGVPSIFTARPVPSMAARPIVLAATVVADVDEDFLVAQGRSITRDVAVYGNAQTDFDRIVAAAERIRSLFHRQAIPVAGYHCLPIVASGPIDAPADPQEIGRIVTLTIRLRNLPWGADDPRRHRGA